MSVSGLEITARTDTHKRRQVCSVSNIGEAQLLSSNHIFYRPNGQKRFIEVRLVDVDSSNSAIWIARMILYTVMSEIIEEFRANILTKNLVN